MTCRYTKRWWAERSCPHPLSVSPFFSLYIKDEDWQIGVISTTASSLGWIKYNPNSDYYNDDCFAYSTEKGTDIILKDRKQEFIDNNMTVCEENCKFVDYNYTIKKAKCFCEIKLKIPFINDIKFNTDE